MKSHSENKLQTPRFGLCCAFVKEKIHFKRTTAAALEKLKKRERVQKIRDIIENNVRALESAIRFCSVKGIGCFRINSQILPLKTHPKFGYKSSLLGEGLVEGFKQCGVLAREKAIRLTFHPDQFVVLNSVRKDVVKSSIMELEYQAEVASWVGADVINIHAGGAYGDKPSALKRLTLHFANLSEKVRSRLSLENDERTYSPLDLLEICVSNNIPLVYDVHHHRLNGDGLTIGAATEAVLSTWHKREALFHISSPFNGWPPKVKEGLESNKGQQNTGRREQSSQDKPGAHRDIWRLHDLARHHDYINPQDFPTCWRHLSVTIEVEAKAKELAVLQLMRDLEGRSEGRSKI